MSIYRHFAHVYDIFMAGVPYAEWADYIDNALQASDIPKDGEGILDLACGTGNLTLLMAQKGYDMIGVDVSPDMLAEAQSKVDNTLFLMQDMRELELYGTVDAIYCSCDGLNYMLTEADFSTVLKKAALYLNPGGLFIFDLNTVYKYQNLLGEEIFTDTIKKSSYLWKNRYDSETCINEYRVSFFTKDTKGKPITFEEIHHQRAFDMETVTTLAQQAGFKEIKVFDNYSHNPPHDKSERLTFLAGKGI